MTTPASRPARLASLILIAMTLLTLAGCHKDAQALVEQNTSALGAVRARLVDSQTALDKTTTAISDLTSDAPNPDLRKSYDNFTWQSDSLVASTKALDTAVAKLKSTHDAYLAAWDKDIAAIVDPITQALAKERRNVSAAKIQTVFDHVKAVRDAQDAYITDLTDMRMLLNHDLTPAGIAVTKDVVKKTYDAARGLRSTLNDALAQVDDVSTGPAQPANVK